MVKILRALRRDSFLPVFFACCIGLWSAYPCSAQGDLLKKITPVLTSDELEELYQDKLDHGVKNSSILSAFLLRSSKKYLTQGEIQKAVEYGEYAQKLAPSYPPVYSHLGKVYWTQNRLRIFAVLEGWIDSVRAAINNYSFSIIIISCFA